jgi:hypothetical protein
VEGVPKCLAYNGEPVQEEYCSRPSLSHVYPETGNSSPHPLGLPFLQISLLQQLKEMLKERDFLAAIYVTRQIWFNKKECTRY